MCPPFPLITDLLSSRYLIFFCPLDLFYKCVCFLPVKLIFVAMKEVVRVRKIAVGIHHAHHHYHHGWFIMIATGWVKGKQNYDREDRKKSPQWVKELAAKTWWPNLIPGIHTVENSLPQGVQ